VLVETKDQTVIGRILKAVETRDKAELITTLNEANQILTERSAAHFKDKGTLSKEVDNVIEAIKNENTHFLYLGDGGYSRLEVGIYLGKPDVTLSNSSTERVKARWHNLQEEYNKAT